VTVALAVSAAVESLLEKSFDRGSDALRAVCRHALTRRTRESGSVGRPHASAPAAASRLNIAATRAVSGRRASGIRASERRSVSDIGALRVEGVAMVGFPGRPRGSTAGNGNTRGAMRRGCVAD
jgi:hypothetical protein